MEDEGVGSRPHYFFDTNAWLAYLAASDNLQGSRGEHYANFLEGVIYLNGITNPKQLKCYKFIPKIVVSSLLFSELCNAYFHQIAYVSYLEKSGYARSDYSFKEYRKNADFLKKKALLQANIEATQNSLLFVDDYFNELKPLELLQNLPLTSDFNDFYYYSWLKHIEKTGLKISIVTDDGDFSYEDIEIITYNDTLRKLPKKNKI